MEHHFYEYECKYVSTAFAMVTYPKPIPLFIEGDMVPEVTINSSHLRFRSRVSALRVLAFQKQLVFWYTSFFFFQVFRVGKLFCEFSNPSKPASSGEVVSLMSFP
jgi:hypothetical protein